MGSNDAPAAHKPVEPYNSSCKDTGAMLPPSMDGDRLLNPDFAAVTKNTDGTAFWKQTQDASPDTAEGTDGGYFAKISQLFASLRGAVTPKHSQPDVLFDASAAVESEIKCNFFATPTQENFQNSQKHDSGCANSTENHGMIADEVSCKLSSAGDFMSLAGNADRKDTVLYCPEALILSDKTTCLDSITQPREKYKNSNVVNSNFLASSPGICSDNVHSVSSHSAKKHILESSFGSARQALFGHYEAPHFQCSDFEEPLQTYSTPRANSASIWYKSPYLPDEHNIAVVSKVESSHPRVQTFLKNEQPFSVKKFNSLLEVELSPTRPAHQSSSGSESCIISSQPNLHPQSRYLFELDKQSNQHSVCEPGILIGSLKPKGKFSNSFQPTWPSTSSEKEEFKGCHQGHSINLLHEKTPDDKIHQNSISDIFCFPVLAPSRVPPTVKLSQRLHRRQSKAFVASRERNYCKQSKNLQGFIYDFERMSYEGPKREMKLKYLGADLRDENQSAPNYEAEISNSSEASIYKVSGCHKERGIREVVYCVSNRPTLGFPVLPVNSTESFYGLPERFELLSTTKFETETYYGKLNCVYFNVHASSCSRDNYCSSKLRPINNPRLERRLRNRRVAMMFLGFYGCRFTASGLVYHSKDTHKKTHKMLSCSQKKCIMFLISCFNRVERADLKSKSPRSKSLTFFSLLDPTEELLTTRVLDSLKSVLPLFSYNRILLSQFDCFFQSLSCPAFAMKSVAALRGIFFKAELGFRELCKLVKFILMRHHVSSERNSSTQLCHTVTCMPPNSKVVIPTARRRTKRNGSTMSDKFKVFRFRKKAAILYNIYRELSLSAESHYSVINAVKTIPMNGRRPFTELNFSRRYFKALASSMCHRFDIHSSTLFCQLILSMHAYPKRIIGSLLRHKIFHKVNRRGWRIPIGGCHKMSHSTVCNHIGRGNLMPFSAGFISKKNFELSTPFKDLDGINGANLRLACIRSYQYQKKKRNLAHLYYKKRISQISLLNGKQESFRACAKKLSSIDRNNRMTLNNSLFLNAATHQSMFNPRYEVFTSKRSLQSESNGSSITTNAASRGDSKNYLRFKARAHSTPVSHHAAETARGIIYTQKLGSSGQLNIRDFNVMDYRVGISVRDRKIRTFGDNIKSELKHSGTTSVSLSRGESVEGPNHLPSSYYFSEEVPSIGERSALRLPSAQNLKTFGEGKAPDSFTSICIGKKSRSEPSLLLFFLENSAAIGAKIEAFAANNLENEGTSVSARLPASEGSSEGPKDFCAEFYANELPSNDDSSCEIELLSLKGNIRITQESTDGNLGFTTNKPPSIERQQLSDSCSCLESSSSSQMRLPSMVSNNVNYSPPLSSRLTATEDFLEDDEKMSQLESSNGIENASSDASGWLSHGTELPIAERANNLAVRHFITNTVRDSSSNSSEENLKGMISSDIEVAGKEASSEPAAKQLKPVGRWDGRVLAQGKALSPAFSTQEVASDDILRSRGADYSKILLEKVKELMEAFPIDSVVHNGFSDVIYGQLCGSCQFTRFLNASAAESVFKNKGLTFSKGLNAYRIVDLLGKGANGVVFLGKRIGYRHPEELSDWWDSQDFAEIYEQIYPKIFQPIAPKCASSQQFESVDIRSSHPPALLSNSKSSRRDPGKFKSETTEKYFSDAASQSFYSVPRSLNDASAVDEDVIHFEQLHENVKKNSGHMKQGNSANEIASDAATLMPGSEEYHRTENREESRTNVAIKIVNFLEAYHCPDGGKALAQSMNEALTLSYLNHPNIVKFYEAFLWPPSYLVLVTEYIPGGSLKDFCKRCGPLPEKVISFLMKDVLEAVRYLHEGISSSNRAILHRDLKASNILLDFDGNAKLIDFGISHIFSHDTEKCYDLIGTPQWMAPEVIKNPSFGYDVKADIWSIGIITYELACGEAPWPKNIKQKQLFRLISEGPSPKINLNEGFEKSFCYFLEGCLQRDPERRKSADFLLNHQFFVKYASDSERSKFETLEKLKEYVMLENQKRSTASFSWMTYISNFFSKREKLDSAKKTSKESKLPKEIDKQKQNVDSCMLISPMGIKAPDNLIKTQENEHDGCQNKNSEAVLIEEKAALAQKSFPANEREPERTVSAAGAYRDWNNGEEIREVSGEAEESEVIEETVFQRQMRIIMKNVGSAIDGISSNFFFEHHESVKHPNLAPCLAEKPSWGSEQLFLFRRCKTEIESLSRFVAKQPGLDREILSLPNSLNRYPDCFESPLGQDSMNEPMNIPFPKERLHGS